MALPVHGSDGAPATDGCVCHKCHENSEVPLAFRSSLQSGRKAPLDCGFEVWLRLGLILEEETAHSRLTLENSSAIWLCLPPPWLVAGAWPPEAAEEHVTGAVHNWKPAALWSACGASQTHLPWIAELHLYPSPKITACAFLCRGVLSGEKWPLPLLH